MSPDASDDWVDADAPGFSTRPCLWRSLQIGPADFGFARHGISSVTTEYGAWRIWAFYLASVIPVQRGQSYLQ